MGKNGKSYIDNMIRQYGENWIVASLCFGGSIFILAFLYTTRRIDEYSPITFYMIMYIMMYFVAPLYDIINGNTLVYGVDLLEYGVRGIINAFIGFISFRLCIRS